jgi:hypothetical protein
LTTKDTRPPITEVFWPISITRDTAVAASQKAKNQTSLHAFQAVEKYLNGIILQWNRIVAFTYAKDFGPIYFEIAELEIQFYLACWDMVEKYLVLFAKEERDRAIYVAVHDIRPILHDASSARNYYEHSNRELKEKGIGPTGHGFGYPRGFHLTYPKMEDGKRASKDFDLGMPEIKLLIQVFDEIVAILDSRVQRT